MDAAWLAAGGVIFALCLILGVILRHLLRSNYDLQRQIQASSSRTLQVQNLVIKKAGHKTVVSSPRHSGTGLSTERKRTARRLLDESGGPAENVLPEEQHSNRIDHQQHKRGNSENPRRRRPPNSSLDTPEQRGRMTSSLHRPHSEKDRDSDSDPNVHEKERQKYEKENNANLRKRHPQKSSLKAPEPRRRNTSSQQQPHSEEDHDSDSDPKAHEKGATDVNAPLKPSKNVDDFFAADGSDKEHEASKLDFLVSKLKTAAVDLCDEKVTKVEREAKKSLRKLVLQKSHLDIPNPTKGNIPSHGLADSIIFDVDSDFPKENENEGDAELIDDAHPSFEYYNQQNIFTIDEFKQQFLGNLQPESQQTRDCDSAVGSSVGLASDIRSNFDEQSLRSEEEASAYRPEPEMIEVKSATESRTITVGRDGCKFIAPYAVVDFPAESVDHPIQIEVIPRYECQEILKGMMMITPTIDFHSHDEMVFLKRVRVHLYTPYSASIQGKTVTVEIVRKDRNSRTFQPFTTAELDQKSWVSFWCVHFCRFGGAVAHVDRPRTKKRYYSAGIVRDTTQPLHRVVSWMICEDMPNIKELNKEYIEAQDRRKVIDAESFEIGYEYNLRLKLESKGKMRSPSESEEEAARGCEISLHEDIIELPLHQRYGTGFDEKSTFFLSTGERESFFLGLSYKVYAISVDTDMENRKIFDKPAYLDWSVTVTPPVHVNAIGTHSTGIKIGMPHSDSDVPQTSGYGTGLENVGTAEASADVMTPSLIDSSPVQNPRHSRSLLQNPLVPNTSVNASGNHREAVNQVGHTSGEGQNSAFTQFTSQVEDLISSSNNTQAKSLIDLGDEDSDDENVTDEGRGFQGQ